MNKYFLILALIVLSCTGAAAQKIGFINSETIREKFAEAKQAEQRLQSMVEEWKRELASMQQQIENLQFDIKKNRLIWTDSERSTKERELQAMLSNKELYAKNKFEPNGEYDMIVKQVMKPIEEKIYAAVQDVSANEGYDIIWDQSVQPLAYVNFKYDATVKVLRKLGVDVADLERDLNKKIDSDPRNDKKNATAKPKRKSRSGSDEDKEEAKDPAVKDAKPANPDSKPDAANPQPPDKKENREFERLNDEKKK